MCVRDKTQIAHEVLSYLAENSDAQDTLEGIVEWWLLEQKIKCQTANVKEVLNELTAQKLILELKAKDARTYYRINRRNMKNIRAFLEQGS